MQALMLAAGMGKRLGMYTRNGTKCMVRVNGKALIEYAIESLVQAKIERMVIVVGYKSDVLKNYISSKFNESNLGGMKIEYIENSVYDKTNNIYSFYLARNELLKDDTILLESDVIYKPEMILNLVNAEDKNLAVVSKFESWMDGTCALIDNDCNIVGMVDKKAFSWNATENYYKTVNIYKFSKEFADRYYIPFLEAYQKAFGKNEYYEQVLKVLTFLGSSTLKAFVVPGDDWYEIDDPADLAIASDRFAKGKEKLSNFQHRFGGYWRFPKMLDFCYLVNPYFPPRQMVEEMKASFDVLMSQYPSGAAQQSLLASKIWNILPEQVAVGNGAAELISSLGKLMSGKCAIPYPTFNEYPERFASMETVAVPTKEDFTYTADDILEVVKKEKCSCVLLINPDNPSGNFLKQDETEYLLEELRKLDAKLIFDESFIDFAQKEIRYTMITSQMLAKHGNLIAVKSISKSYGIPGFRLGILASNDTEFVGKIKKANAIWNINSFGEYFFQIYEKYSKTYLASCDRIAEERERFILELKKIPCLKVYPSQSNFVMIRLEGCKYSSTELTLKLLEDANIFIKDLSGKKCFEQGGFIRLAVRSREDDDKLLEAFKMFLS